LGTFDLAHRKREDDEMTRLLTTGLALGLGAAIAACAPSAPTPSLADGSLMALVRGASQAEAEQIAARISHRPLGSRENPVRADMPAGQRAYLARLRCSDGRAPVFSRGGSAGVGPYGSMLDVYEANCAAGASPASAEIFIDMYRSGHVESKTVPGFTIVAP
jgi:hypothetical protein